MTTLRDLQEAFFAGVTGKDDRAAYHLRATPELTRSETLAIYRGSVTGTHVEALAQIYPVCRRLVGVRFFDAMATVYQRTHRAFSPNLVDYGEQFAAFIERYEPARTLEYLPDMATLEWAWHRAFHALDEDGLDAAALSALDAAALENMRFHLPVSASLVSSRYPVNCIWQVNQADFSGNDQVDLDTGSVCLLVWRQGYDVRIDPLDDDAFRMLTDIEAGFGFTALLDQHRCAPEVIPRFIQHGWIAGFSQPDDT